VTSIHTLIGRRRTTMLVLATVAGLVPAAGLAAATTEPPTDTAPTTEATSTSAAAAEPVDLDTNGDGVVVFGVATPGPRDDGAYYQALVDGIIALSEENGFEEPIIVDNIDPAQAETELRNLARQNVDVIAVGAGELSDPLAALTEEFPDIFWYCNCGAGLDAPGIAQAGDDSSEISYSAGYATGLLLQDTDSTSVAFLGCCDLDFEREAFLAFEAGLQAVDESFTVVYLPTGDFNDVAGATEAFNQAVADGAGAVYPFLGGSHEAIVGLANEAGIITMSAGASDACEREDLTYDIAVQFDGGDYVAAIFEAILAGELSEGERYVFQVGEFEKVGAKLCDATPEQEEALQAVRDQIAAGDFDELFGAIKGEAYGGGAPVTTG
jgi:basic membrane protein A